MKFKAQIQFSGFFLIVIICLIPLPPLIENPGRKEHKGVSENLIAKRQLFLPSTKSLGEAGWSQQEAFRVFLKL